MLGLWPQGKVEGVTRELVIKMWWIYIVMPILFALAIYGFISWTGVEARLLTRKTERTAEDMYDEFARGIILHGLNSGLAFLRFPEFRSGANETRTLPRDRSLWIEQ